jgi:parvulin-like peptidyl-prolyl isomerase
MSRAPRSWIVALLAFAAGCPPPPRPDVVARLAGESVSYLVFEEYVEESVPAIGAPIDAAVLSQLFDRFLEEELLARLAAGRRQAPADRAASIATLVAERTPPVTEAEVASYYEEHRDENAVGPRVDLRQLLVEERQVADQAVARLAGGEPFNRVAQTLVPEGGGVRAWSQRGVAAAELPPAYAGVVFGLPVGGVSPVLEAEEGWVVFQVARRLRAQRLPLAAAAPAIRERLAAARAAETRAALVAEGRDRYDLQVFERNLPFAYGGRFRTPE